MIQNERNFIHFHQAVSMIRELAALRAGSASSSSIECNGWGGASRMSGVSKMTERVDVVDLKDALGRVSAQDYISEEDIPSFGNSSMDGFAVSSRDTQGAFKGSPVCFRVLGTTVAGESPGLSATCAAGQGVLSAWEVMTGAPVPPGYDAVIQVENVECTRDAQGYSKEILVRAPVRAGENFREPGEDFKAGSLVLRRGERIDSLRILGLAAVGIHRVKVVRKPRIAVLSTGDEILSGQVANSSAPFLAAELGQLGAQVSFYGPVSDRFADLTHELEKILSEYPDCLLTTGGVSMGKHDLVKAALLEMGAKIYFHKIQMRPGKPNLLAEFKNGPVVFGLPGNPVSTVVGLRFLVEPFLREWMGQPRELPWRIPLEQDVEKPPGLRCFFKASLSGKASVRVLPGQASFMIRPLLLAQVWAVLPENPCELKAGTEIDVYPLHSFHRIEGIGAEDGELYRSEGGCC